MDETSKATDESSTKKQKKSDGSASTTAGKLGGIFTSGLEAASNVINAVVETVGSFTGGGDRSLLGDAKNVAESVAASKTSGKKSKGTAKAAKCDAADESRAAPSNDVFEGFDGAEASTTLIPNGTSEIDDDLDADEETLTLLKGFDSGSEDEASGDEGFKAGQAVPKVPTDKALAKKLKDMKQKDVDEPGVIYVGYYGSSIRSP